MTENEMAGWCYRLNGHRFEQAKRAGDGQGILVYLSPKCQKESYMTEQLS